MSSDQSAGGPVPPGGTVRVLSGFYEGLEVALDRNWLVIGRGRGADIAISEATISRAHAAVGYDKNGFFVQDLESTNGTTVGGAKVVKQTLKNGDEIRMGRLELAVSLPG